MTLFTNTKRPLIQISFHKAPIYSFLNGIIHIIHFVIILITYKILYSMYSTQRIIVTTNIKTNILQKKIKIAIYFFFPLHLFLLLSTIFTIQFQSDFYPITIKISLILRPKFIQQLFPLH